ncbi:DJ-1/PfpI family protein [Streptomyces pimonensis]|uniref:DJ-1/PfpI family protein n=1 Tax=Streptomyces pimonensis TaxID=2860288 RepID=A0ABV4J4K0_9ACTN
MPSSRPDHDPGQRLPLISVRILPEGRTRRPRGDWTLRSLSLHAGPSERRISRLFRAGIGMTAREYVKRARVAVASRLLIESPQGLEVIARETGFGTEATMRRSFLRALQVPPRSTGGGSRDKVAPEPEHIQQVERVGEFVGMESSLTIGVFVFEDAEELDVVGPWEVLGFWAAHVATVPVRVLTIGREEGWVRCAKGLRLAVDHGLATAPALDVLIHPGGDGTQPLKNDRVHLDWLKDLHQRGVLLASVCTGSLVLAAAGLLRGRPATTHHNYTGKLAAVDDTIDVRAVDRYVDDGDIVTSAGVSAGIDMAFHLVERLDSAEAAAEVRQGTQYDRPVS